jgi:hypothetical protein
MSYSEIQFIFFPFMHAIALTPLSLWDQSDPEDLDFSVMRLYLGIVAEESYMRNYTIDTQAVTNVLPEQAKKKGGGGGGGEQGKVVTPPLHLQSIPIRRTS